MGYRSTRRDLIECGGLNVSTLRMPHRQITRVVIVSVAIATVVAGVAVGAITRTTKGALPTKTAADITALASAENTVANQLKLFQKLGKAAPVGQWETNLKNAESTQSRDELALNSDLAVPKPQTSTTTTVSSSPYPNGEQGDKDFAVSSIQVSADFAGDIGGTIRITNVGSVQRSIEFTVTFFATKNFNSQPLGSAIGFADAVAPGQTVTESLTSQNPMFTQTTFYYQFQVSAEF